MYECIYTDIYCTGYTYIAYILRQVIILIL